MARAAAIYAVFDSVRNLIICVFFAGVILICGVEVFLRYTGLPVLGWTVEVVKYMNVWIILLGASVAAKHSLHLTMPLMLNAVPERHRTWVRRAVEVVVICFLSIFLYYSAQKTIQNIPQTMMEFPVSVAWTYLALPVGFLCMLLEYFLILVYGSHPFVQQEATAEEGSSPTRGEI